MTNRFVRSRARDARQRRNDARLGSMKTVDLADVSATAPTDGQVLEYDAAAGVYTPATSANAFNDLSDVTITSAAQPDILQYNGTAWVNVDGGCVNYKSKLRALGATSIWMQEETSGTIAIDEMGVQDGTYVSSPILNGDGPLAGGGGAPDFDGSADHTLIGDVADLEFTPNGSDITVSVWCKRDSGNDYAALSKNQQFNLFYFNNFIRCRIGGGTAVACTTNTADTDWHHVGVRSNGTNFEIWLDGVNEAQGSCGSTSYGAARWVIGALDNSTGTSVAAAFWNGDIGPVAIFNDTYLNDEAMRALARGTNVA